MSKSKDSDSDVDIYEDLPNFSSDNTISELENAKKNLENELKTLQLKLKDIHVENNKLKKENEALSINISSLYKTAACEIKRKDQMIQELRKEKDTILFRRQRKETQKRSFRNDAPPKEVYVIDDYQPPAENEVCIIEENRQQDYTSYQYADNMQYDENYGEDEVIETFPEEEEDEDYMVRNTPQEVPDTIFSRRKAQQLKLLMKKSDSLKDSTRVEVLSEDPEIIIEDSNKSQSTVFDRRKNQTLKSCHKQRDISKTTFEVNTACSPALDDHALSVKGKSSTVTLGSKNVDLSHKKTELSTSKHLVTVSKTVEANVKTSSKVNEVPSASLKVTQSSRTKSHHKPKDHSDVHKSHREKHSHVSSKDKRSVSDTHSHRKSSSSSKSKFSTHSSSHRSSTKSSFSPRSPKGRSIRETSVSRALKSLRSKSQLKDLDCKSSRSSKERDRHKEVENQGSKKGESQRHKKTDHTAVKSQISSKSIPEKSRPRTPLPDIQLVTENVCTKPKLAPESTKTVIIVDSETSNINQDVYMKTKNHSEKQNGLQEERLAKSSEKEQNSTKTDNVAIGDNALCEENIMEVQTDKISHKEDSSKTLTVSSTPQEDITEVQGNCGRQEDSSKVMTDKKTLGGEVPTNSDKEDVSRVSQHSGSSENKSISETPMDIDLPPKKRIGEMPVVNRKVTEDAIDDDGQHKESMSERLTGEDVLHNKEATDVDLVHKEVVTKDSLISAKKSNNTSNETNVILKTTVPNLEPEVSIADTLLTPTEQAENVKTTRESAEVLQDSVTTNQEDVTAAENSDLSTNLHAEENNTLSSHQEEKRLFNSFHHENLQCADIKDRKKNCSIGASKNFVEVERLERPIDASENGQIVSSTLQADVEERNTTSGIPEEQSVPEKSSEHSLLNNKDSNPSLQELVSEALAAEKEPTKSVNPSLPNPDESLSPTATFKKGNISFAVVNEPGCFKRRKFKRINNDNSSNTGVSNVIKKATDEHLHNEKLSGTKRPYERLDAESSISPPVKIQAFADPQRDQVYPSAIEDRSVEDSSQRHLESNSIQTDENNTSVIEINASNDKNNTPDLEEGEIEDSESDEKASEGNKKLNKDMQGVKVVKSVIHTESNIRKDQSRKYLELGRKARENRRKPHGSHLQEVARGNRDRRHLPKKLFSHCKRRSPSELLVKDRNIKVGTKEKDQNSRSRSTSSETIRSTNESKNEKLEARYRTKENKVDTKSKCIREEKKETKVETKASSITKSVLQNTHVNKPKDLSAWTQLGNRNNNEGSDAPSSRKENTVTLNGDNQDSFKIPVINNQAVTPVTKYIIKRRKVCNLQDNVSVPVVNISPPKSITTTKSENFKSVHLKTVAASNVGIQASEVNLTPSWKTHFSKHSKEMLISKTSTSASRPSASQTNVNRHRISAENKSLVRSCKTLCCQVSSGSSGFSSSSSEYENNSDETWNPKRRRKRKGRKNPKTEVTKHKANEISL